MSDIAERAARKIVSFEGRYDVRGTATYRIVQSAIDEAVAKRLKEIRELKDELIENHFCHHGEHERVVSAPHLMRLCDAIEGKK